MRDRLAAELSDRYEIERELGRGGMATVWLARDRRHDRSVALKVLHTELAGAIGAERFAREVRTTARLQHPGIVPVLDSGVLPADGDTALPWYSMAYLAGESLRARLARDRQLPVDEALRIAREAAAALDVAHRAGVVHRDVKPENIILCDGHVYVVDFGIAKALLDTGDERLTSTGIALGTPAYMSPEQATSDVIDARTDQYSLAAVLYEMLAGEPPFTGLNAQSVIARRLAEPPRPIRSVRSAVPERVEAVVLRALERVSADRYPDIATFAAELERAAAAAGGHRAIARPKRVVVLATAVAILLVGVMLAVAETRRAARRAELLGLYDRGMRGYELRTTEGAMEAIRSFDAALARDSSYALAWAGLAKTYIRINERQFRIPGIRQDSIFRLAVTSAGRAIALDSTNSDAWAAQAAAIRKIDPTDDRPVLRAARRAIALDSANGQAWHFLALSLAETGDMPGALEAWRQCVRRNPTYTLCLAFFAIGHYWHGQFDSAGVWVDSALAVDPNYLLARTTMGEIETERGNYVRAAAAYETARRLTTDIEQLQAIVGSAIVEARSGHGAAARTTLRLADSLARAFDPPPVHLAVYTAHAYAALGDADHALAWLARYPEQADVHFHLHVLCDAPFRAIAGDPRYRALVARVPPGGC